jgi:hypothetical protein
MWNRKLQGGYNTKFSKPEKYYFFMMVRAATKEFFYQQIGAAELPKSFTLSKLETCKEAFRHFISFLHINEV